MKIDRLVSIIMVLLDKERIEAQELADIIDKNVFSTADLSAILMGLSSLSDMIRGNEVINALSKVKNFIPADRANDIELKTNFRLCGNAECHADTNKNPYS